ncbi:MAG: hypothetical protein AAB223_12460 [Pseudomonadota bacterium]
MPSDILRRRGAVLIAAAVLLGIAPVFGTPARAQQAKPPQPQVSNEGQVTVKVAPLTLSTGAETWRFEVEFNTHTVPLTQDLLAVAVLTGPGGEDRRPVTWEGDPPGGHHRKGILVFKPISPAPTSVTLRIRQIGTVAERSFTWPLP